MIWPFEENGDMLVRGTGRRARQRGILTKGGCCRIGGPDGEEHGQEGEVAEILTERTCWRVGAARRMR